MRMTILALAIAVCASLSRARLIVVFPDSSGLTSPVAEAADTAVAGDSLMLRDGPYVEWPIVIDSGVVMFAEHPGAAELNCGPWPEPGITLRGTAKISGFPIWGDIYAIVQILVNIQGGPATVHNCWFQPLGDHGLQMAFHSNGQAPIIRHCRFFTENGASPIVENFDTTTVWMPYNYYQRTDTTQIHWDIWDGEGHEGGQGHVFISPVLDYFDWLAANPRLPMTVHRPSIQVFPNPSPDGRLQVILPVRIPIDDISVYNILSQKVWTMHSRGQVNDPALNLNLPLSSGTYFLTVTQAQIRHSTVFTLFH
jgi:hypothetical protein